MLPVYPRVSKDHSSIIILILLIVSMLSFYFIILIFLSVNGDIILKFKEDAIPIFEHCRHVLTYTFNRGIWTIAHPCKVILILI